MQLSEEAWKQKLTPEQYHVLREKGTEMPGSGTLLHNDKTGDYTCAACGAVLFKSKSKYVTTTPGLTGWPSFSDAVDGAVNLISDDSLLMHRVEVQCKNCGSHLGHVFYDIDSPTNQHFCINSAALDFQKKK
jgi:peptide-methionine (R)-S-oxide reductase